MSVERLHVTEQLVVITYIDKNLQVTIISIDLLQQYYSSQLDIKWTEVPLRILPPRSFQQHLRDSYTFTFQNSFQYIIIQRQLNQIWKHIRDLELWEIVERIAGIDIPKQK